MLTEVKHRTEASMGTPVRTSVKLIIITCLNEYAWGKREAGNAAYRFVSP
jgi:hypothetical protein